MTGHDQELEILVEGRFEKGKPVDVVPMGVGEQQNRLPDTVFDVPLAKLADAGARIQNDVARSGLNLDTARVPAVDQVAGCRAGNAPTGTPECDVESHEIARRNPNILCHVVLLNL
jgi:hypothetical protein